MSPRLWLLLFLLTSAIGVTVWMVGDKPKPVLPEEADAEAAKNTVSLEPAPVAKPIPVEPEPPPTFAPKLEKKSDHPSDATSLPGPSDTTTAPDRATPTPNPDDPYNMPPPVDGSPGYQPPTAYPPPAYPPPVYPDGGFEGDIPPPPPGEYDPDGGGIPPGNEGF